MCRYLHEYNEAIECFFTAMSRTGTSPLLASAAARKDSPVRSSPPQSQKTESASMRPAGEPNGNGARPVSEGAQAAMATAKAALAHVHDIDVNAAAADAESAAAGRNEVAQRAQRQLLQTYNDLAVDCLMRGFFREAVQLLNKAIRVEKSELALYMNRGGMWLSCRALWRLSSCAQMNVLLIN